MVQNIIGLNGNAVVNQFVIDTKKATFFQSYQSVVCKIDNSTRKVTLSNHWDYSVTTSKYLYKFLRENGIYVYSKKDVLAKIKANKFRLINKNSISL